MWVTAVPQAIINSTISPNMTFTKTSQKFGQWADSRANTVYGLGFSTEHHLTKVRTHTHTCTRTRAAQARSVSVWFSWKLSHDATSQSSFYNWIASTRQDKFCWVVLMYVATVEDRPDAWETHPSGAAAVEMHDNWLIMCNIGISGQMKSDKCFNLPPQWQQQIISLRGWQENIGDKRQCKSGFQKVFQIELEKE